jgi:hypothetical protein
MKKGPIVLRFLGGWFLVVPPKDVFRMCNLVEGSKPYNCAYLILLTKNLFQVFESRFI